MKLRVGLIGAGAIAHAHLRAYLSNSVVDEVLIADANEAVLQDVLKRYPRIKKTFKDYKQMIEDEPIDVVDICTPHYLHHPIAIYALKAGKDVICEKPIAMTLGEADDMINTAKEMGRRLFISMNQRFMPYHKKAKMLIEDGAIGRPFLAVFNIMGNEFERMNDPNSWKGSWDKAGGGAMIDTGYHAVYMMLHFLGKPKAITAVAKRLIVQPENKADDNTVAIFEFNDNALGTIAISYTVLSESWKEMRHIYGTEGSIHIRDDSPEPLILIKENKQTAVEFGPLEDSIKLAIGHFLDCIINDKEPEVTAEEARDALEVCLAIYESSRKGQRVILNC